MGNNITNNVLRFSIINVFLILCLCLNATTTIASSISESGNMCWNIDVQCPYQTLSMLCPASYPYYCPQNWTLERADGVDVFVTSGEDISTDPGNPKFVPSGQLINLTAESWGAEYDPYQYTVWITKYNYQQGTWGPWQIEYTYETYGSFSWYQSFNSPGDYAMQVNVRANNVYEADVKSDILYFTNADHVESISTTFTPGSGSVVENKKVDITAQGFGAPLGDYDYQFQQHTFIDGNFSDTKILQGPSRDNSFTWTAPPYDARKSYSLTVWVGTISSDNVHGGFSWEQFGVGFYEVLPDNLISITSPPILEAMVGAPFSTTLTYNGGVPPNTWSCSSPDCNGIGALFGISLSPSGVLSGIPTNSTPGQTFTAQVSDSRSVTATQDITLIVYNPFSVQYQTFLNPIIGLPFSINVPVTGGKPPYTCSIVSGALPTGLNLSSGCVASGMPTAIGSYNANFIVRDSQNPPAIASGYFSANVFFPLKIYTNYNIDSSTLPSGTIGSAYSWSLSASGGNGSYSWSATSSSLPPGLSISTSGVISGTPTSAGFYTFTVTVSDGQNPAVTRSITLNVAGTQLQITVTPLGPFKVGIPFSQTLEATGGKGPYTWTMASGSLLPTGLSLSSNGVISGTPTISKGYTFTVRVTDILNGTTISTRYVVVYAPLAITTSSLSSGSVGSAYSQALKASGGNLNFSWSVTSGNLPDGLSLSSTGVVSGTPKSGGSYPFTVQVSDTESPAATQTMAFTIVVTIPPLQITTSTLPDATYGSAYNQVLTATGGVASYAWSIIFGSLPDGFSLSSSGVISGTPMSGGSYSFTIQLSDAEYPAATTTMPFTIVVAVPQLQITTSTLPDGTYGSDYNQVLAATGGVMPYTWSISSGNLPDGLILDSTNGVIRGTPSNVDRFTFTVQVNDAQSTQATTSLAYSLSIMNSAMQMNTTYATVGSCDKSSPSPYIQTNSTTNVVTGAIAHDQELFATKGAAFSTAIELFYNSIPSYNGPLGIGWSHTYDISLKVNTDGSIVLQDGIGSKSFFTKTGSSYISPPGDFSTLVKNGDNSYTISYRDGQKRNFQADGKIASMVDRFNNTISFTYTNGDLTGITDTAQRNTSIIYNQSTVPHRISSITDPNQKTYDFSYQGNSLYRVTHPAADPTVSTERGYWEYQYDSQGFLKSKRDPNDNTSQYTYYADHRMEKAIDPDGISTPAGHTRTITYPTTAGILRTSTLTEKDNGQWYYTYDAVTGAVKEKTDPSGKMIKYTYYPNGFLKSKTEPKDGSIRFTTFYTYDSYGHPLTSTDPVNLSTYIPTIDPETVVDPATLTSLTPPIKPAIRYSYDTNNYDRITSVSDERGATALTTNIQYTIENGGDVVTATAPGNVVTVTKYNLNGKVIETIDANQKHAYYSYYPDTTANRSLGIVGLLWTVTDTAGVTTTVTSYDKSGNPLSIQTKDTAGNVKITSVQQYDALNRLVQNTKATATLPAIITNYSYDNVGNLKSLKDAESRETKYEYNYNRQVTKTTDAKLNDTVFTYSGSGCGSCGGAGVDKLTGVYDANVSKNTPLESQPHTDYSYDQLGRLEYETDPLGKNIHYTYYDNGQIKSIYDSSVLPETLIISHLYNNRGQLTDKSFGDSTFAHYRYDSNGRLQTASNQNISYTYAYYADGRLQSVTDTTNGRTITYDQYDGLGQRKQVTLLSGTPDQRVITYDYDAANRPWHITSNAGQFIYAYDERGRRSTITYPNQTTVSYGYDDLNRLTSLNNMVTGGAVFAGFNYTDFDKVGNRKTKTTATAAESYGYNELYRLLSVTSSKSESFDYDAVGNRSYGPGLKDTGYAHNAANQMTTGRKLNYDYDNSGNQTTRTLPGADDKSWIQTWNKENQLIKVEKTKGAEKRTVSFTYDPLGRRIGKQLTTVIDGATKTKTWSYVYDGDSIAVEIYTDENSTITKTFYTQGSGVDEHLALERGGQFYYYHADGLGSIATITDAAHNIVQSYEYDSFGMAKPSTTFMNIYTYTGREWDRETGLYYYRARYYDPMDGSFVSKDPIGFAGGINLYSYVGGNVQNFVDPYGLDRTSKELDLIEGIMDQWEDANTPYAPRGTKYAGSNATKGKGADCSGSLYATAKEAKLNTKYFSTAELNKIGKNPSVDAYFSERKGVPQRGDYIVFPGHVVYYVGRDEDGNHLVYGAHRKDGPDFDLHSYPPNIFKPTHILTPK